MGEEKVKWMNMTLLIWSMALESSLKCSVGGKTLMIAVARQNVRWRCIGSNDILPSTGSNDKYIHCYFTLLYVHLQYTVQLHSSECSCLFDPAIVPVLFAPYLALYETENPSPLCSYWLKAANDGEMVWITFVELFSESQPWDTLSTFLLSLSLLILSLLCQSPPLAPCLWLGLSLMAITADYKIMTNLPTIQWLLFKWALSLLTHIHCFHFFLYLFLSGEGWRRNSWQF